MNPKTVLRQDTLLVYNPKECGERRKVCPFFLLENSRPLSPWGPLDSLSTCLGTDSLTSISNTVFQPYLLSRKYTMKFPLGRAFLVSVLLLYVLASSWSAPSCLTGRCLLILQLYNGALPPLWSCLDLKQLATSIASLYLVCHFCYSIHHTKRYLFAYISCIRLRALRKQDWALFIFVLPPLVQCHIFIEISYRFDKLSEIELAELDLAVCCWLQRCTTWELQGKFYLGQNENCILECKVKWALGTITINKASGGDGIPAELFQILKDDAVKVLHSICQQIWKTQQWPQDWKWSVFIAIPKKGSVVVWTFFGIALLWD